MADVRNEKQTTTSARRTDTAQPMSPQKETARPSTNLAPRRQGSLALRSRDPFSLLNELHSEMDRLFENIGFGSLIPFSRELDRGLGGEFERSLWSPQIEMFELDGKLHVRADLPGLKKEDVHCDLSDNILTIEGERKRELRDERGGWSERSYGHFFRSIPLPEDVNAESAKASFKDGVLEILVDVPKHEEKKGKKIEIA